MHGVVLRLIILKHLTAILTALATFHLLHALLELRLQPLLTIHSRIGRIVLLRLLVDLLRTFVRIVALLLAVEADDAHVLHLTHRVHHLNVAQLLLADLFLLAVGRFVAFQSTPVEDDLAFIWPHVVLPSVHRLR